MRQAIGSTWLMQLVIIFMLIFVAFLALSINYTKSFKTKNELVNMIEEREGIGSGEDKGALILINNYLNYNNYLMLNFLYFQHQLIIYLFLNHFFYQLNIHIKSVKYLVVCT